MKRHNYNHSSQKKKSRDNSGRGHRGASSKHQSNAEYELMCQMKALEVENALRLQRRSSETTIDNQDQHSGVASSTIQQIPGFVYDSETRRYYKDNKPNNSKPKNIEKPKQQVFELPMQKEKREVFDMLREYCTRIPGRTKARSKLIKQSIGTAMQTKSLNANNLQFCTLSFQPNMGWLVASPDILRLFNRVSSTPSTPMLWDLGIDGNQERITMADIAPIPIKTIFVITQSISNERKSYLRVLRDQQIANGRKEMNKSILRAVWDVNNLNIYIGHEKGMSMINLESLNEVNLKPRRAVTAITNSLQSENLVYFGERNGSIAAIDLRSNEIIPIFDAQQYEKVMLIDHMATLNNGTNLLAQDITGKVLLFDFRKPNHIYNTICSGSGMSKIRPSKFFLSGSGDFLATASNSQESSFVSIRQIYNSVNENCIYEYHPTLDNRQQLDWLTICPNNYYSGSNVGVLDRFNSNHDGIPVDTSHPWFGFLASYCRDTQGAPYRNSSGMFAML